MIAEGPAAWLRQPGPAESSVTKTPREALREVAEDLRNRAERASEDAAAMLRVQAMMAQDPVLLGRIDGLVAAGVPAERAITRAAASFQTSNTDLRDVVRRAVAVCQGRGPSSLPRPGHPFVLFAEALGAADMIDIYAADVRAIVTVEGGPTSHAAILARAMGIPAIIGLADAAAIRDGDYVYIDTDTRRLSRAPLPPATTVPPHPVAAEIELLANVGSPAEARAALAAGAGGIGLLRTEFLFPDPGEPPSTAEQLRRYQSMLVGFEEKPVVIRVFDAGARDENPLGQRGLRALRDRPETLDTQLAAIAGLNRRVSVMAPMVCDAREARWFHERARAHGLTDIGVMIEVPSAALCAEEILSVVDFASIGTNDLVQFTLAADRQLAALAAYQDASHPAVLRLIGMVAEAGRRLGKPVGVCGEAAADPRLAATFAGLGVTSLSMTPAALAGVRTRFAGAGIPRRS